MHMHMHTPKMRIRVSQQAVDRFRQSLLDRVDDVLVDDFEIHSMNTCFQGLTPRQHGALSTVLDAALQHLIEDGTGAGCESMKLSLYHAIGATMDACCEMLPVNRRTARRALHVCIAHLTGKRHWPCMLDEFVEVK